MENFKLKLKIICLPFVLVLLGTVVVCTLLHWLYLVSGADVISQDFLEFFIPIALPAIPIFIWLYPRFKLLKNRKTGKGDAFNPCMLAWIFTILPLIATQMYVSKAAGKLTTLNNVSQLSKLPKTTYYKLNAFYVDKSKVCYYVTSDVSGRYNENLNFTIYAVMPVYSDAFDTIAPDSAAWLGHKYTHQTNNHKTAEEKQDEYSRFRTEMMDEFKGDDFRGWSYLKRMPKSSTRDGYIKALRDKYGFNAANIVFFDEEFGDFEARNGNTLSWCYIALAGCSIGGSLILMLFGFDEQRLNAYQVGKPVEEEGDDASVWTILIPRTNYFVTPLLIDINIGIFLWMAISGLGFISFQAADLLKYGADYTPYTTNGQWWRLVTSMFLHGGLMHVLANMYCLMFIGIFLEPKLGAVKYFAAYMITGIAGSLASIWWHAATVSVGASGAIFGLYGVFLALLLFKVFPADVNKGLLTSTLIFIGFNLALGLTGGVDNAAHIGGLVSGFLLGLLLYQDMHKPEVM